MLGKLLAYRKRWLFASWLTWTLFSLAPIVVGVLNKAIFDSLDPAGGGQLSLWILLLALAAATVSMSLLGLLWFWVHSTFEPTLEALLRTNLFAWVLTTAGRRGRQASPVTLLGHLRDDVPEYSGLVNEWYRLAGEAAFVAVALVIMVRIDPVVTLVTFLPLAGVVLFTHWMRRALPRLWGEAREATTITTDFIGEVFGGVQAVKVAGAEAGVVRRLAHLSRTRAAAEVRSQAATVRIEAVSEAAVMGGRGLILLVAAGAMLAGRFTVGDFVLFTIYLEWMLELPRRLGRLLSQIKTAERSKQRLEEALGGTPVHRLVVHRPVHLTGPVPEPSGPPDVTSDRLRELRLENLTFTYGDVSQHGEGSGSGRGVSNVSLCLSRGTITVVTGEVGSGKSTLLQVVLGLLRASEGRLWWNDTHVTDPASFMVPPRAAYKPQGPRIFSEPLGAGIRLGLPHDPQAMERALRRSAFAEDVALMRKGLDTMVGLRGLTLSGGQLQRASAARMFIRPAELYVIDDLSSALDNATEDEVWAQVDASRAEDGTTYFVVSHRAEVLLRADQVVVLREGRVHHLGTLAELRDQAMVVRRILAGGTT